MNSLLSILAARRKNEYSQSWRRNSGTARRTARIEQLEPRLPLVSVHGEFIPGSQLTIEGNFDQFDDTIFYADFASSISPSGQFTNAKVRVQNLCWTADAGRNGGGVISADPGVGDWTLGIEHEIEDGATITISRDVRRSFTISDPTQNYKTFRAYNNGSDEYPNLYFAPNNARVYTEAVPEINGDNGDFGDPGRTALESLDWVTERIIIRGSGGTNRTDGFIQVFYDAELVASAPLLTRPHGVSLALLYVFHEVIATTSRWNTPWSDDNVVRADNIFVGKGDLHVVASSHERLSESDRLVVLPTLSSPQEGIVNVLVPNAGVFGHGEVVFVHVVDGATTIDQNGYAMTVGEVPPSPSAPPFQQSSGPDGLVLMEAEDAHCNLGQGGKNWTGYTEVAGYSGRGAVKATPVTGVRYDTTGGNASLDYVLAGPRLDFRIDFLQTGLHYVWVRGLGASSQENSVHVGLNGQAMPSADRMDGFPTGYGWRTNTLDGVVATIEIPSTGIHTLNVWMREDGTVVDMVLLSTNSAYAPLDPPLDGDFDFSGIVDQGDLDLVLGNWGQEMPAPSRWIHDLADHVVDQAELDRVLTNWGATSAAGAQFAGPLALSKRSPRVIGSKDHMKQFAEGNIVARPQDLLRARQMNKLSKSALVDDRRAATDAVLSRWTDKSVSISLNTFGFRHFREVPSVLDGLNLVRIAQVGRG